MPSSLKINFLHPPIPRQSTLAPQSLHGPLAPLHLPLSNHLICHSTACTNTHTSQDHALPPSYAYFNPPNASPPSQREGVNVSRHNSNFLNSYSSSVSATPLSYTQSHRSPISSLPVSSSTPLNNTQSDFTPLPEPQNCVLTIGIMPAKQAYICNLLGLC